MKELLHDYIRNYVQLTENELRELDYIMSYRTLKKREHFIEANQRCSKILFTAKGYFRFYHLDQKGNEITSDFYFAPTFISSYTSFITGNHSLVYVQAMEDMEVLEFQRSDLYALFDKYPKIELLGRLIAESVVIYSEEHLFLLLNHTAKMRYKRLLESYPDYVNTIPLQYIASYLGITKETLSRMRKSL